MTLQTSAKTLTLGALLNGNSQYRIPDYQRNYAWKAEEITQLIEDVHNAQQARLERYFLGNLVTTLTNDTDVYDVVDGQQRMTTLVLLLSALRLSLGPEHESAMQGSERVLTFAARPQATSAVRRLARATIEQQTGSTSVPFAFAVTVGGEAIAGDKHATGAAGSSTDDEMSGAVQGLYDGYMAIITALADADLTSDQTLRSFRDYLLSSVQVVQVVLPEGTDLNRYFEVMNTRGVQLEPTDIVRARLMGTFGRNMDKQRSFQRIWDSCARMDSYIQLTLARGNTNLRTTIFGDDWRWLKFSDFNTLSNHLEEHYALDQEPEGLAAAGSGRSLQAMLQVYEQPQEQAPAQEEEEGNRAYRSTLRFPFFLLHALSLFREREELGAVPTSTQSVAGPETSDDPTLDDKQLLAQFDRVFTGAGPELVERFAIHLLQVRNVYDTYIIRREESETGPDDGVWTLKTFEKTRDNQAKNLTYRNTFGQDAEDEADSDVAQHQVVLLESMLRITYTSPRTMRWVTLVLRTTMLHHFPTNAEPRREVLDAYKLNRILREHTRSRIPHAYRSRPTEINEKRPLGFEIPRIVYTYLDFLLLDRQLDSRENNDHTGEESFEPISSKSFTYRFRNSVEHFAPSTPDPDLTPTPINESLRQSLGNLALITVSQNSKFSNASPLAKADTNDEVLKQSPKLWRMAYLTKTQKWTNKSIEEHHTECLEILYEDLSGKLSMKKPMTGSIRQEMKR